MQSIHDSIKREKSDRILEMSSILNKVEDVASMKVDISKNLNSIGTLIACMVQREALTMAFEGEKDAKIIASLKEMRALIVEAPKESGFFVQRKSQYKVISHHNQPNIQVKKQVQNEQNPYGQ